MLERLPVSAYRSSSDAMGLGGRRRRTGSLGPGGERAARGSAAAEAGSSWSGFAESSVEETPGVEPGSPEPCRESLGPAGPGSVFGSVLWSPSGFFWNKKHTKETFTAGEQTLRVHINCDLFLLLFLFIFLYQNL